MNNEENYSPKKIGNYCVRSYLILDGVDTTKDQYTTKVYKLNTLVTEISGISFCQKVHAIDTETALLTLLRYHQNPLVEIRQGQIRINLKTFTNYFLGLQHVLQLLRIYNPGIAIHKTISIDKNACVLHTNIQTSNIVAINRVLATRLLE